MKKRNTKLFILSAFALVCAACAGISYPSDLPLYEDLRSFRAKPLQQFNGSSYRLVWHAWHQTPGLITANCYKGECTLELRYTDGYGTYQQGKLAGRAKVNISNHEYEGVAESFVTNRFGELISYPKRNNPYEETFSEDEDFEEISICLHAPHYYLESYMESEYYVIYRYCEDNYRRDLRVAFPLIELAEKYFPTQMEHVTAVWIQEERIQ